MEGGFFFVILLFFFFCIVFLLLLLVFFAVILLQPDLVLGPQLVSLRLFSSVHGIGKLLGRSFCGQRGDAVLLEAGGHC